ncbi:hypothetical protein AKJ16_DCAP16200 [Drosera capensis]
MNHLRKAVPFFTNRGALFLCPYPNTHTLTQEERMAPPRQRPIYPGLAKTLEVLGAQFNGERFKREAGEAKHEEEGLRIRIEMPGTAKKSLKMRIEKETKALVVSAAAPKEWNSDCGSRIYKAQILIRRIRKRKRQFFRAPPFRGFLLVRKNPFIVKGNEKPQEMKFTTRNHLYIRLDLPDVRPGQEVAGLQDDGTTLLYGTEEARAAKTRDEERRAEDDGAEDQERAYLLL